MPFLGHLQESHQIPDLGSQMYVQNYIREARSRRRKEGQLGEFGGKMGFELGFEGNGREDIPG